MGATTIVVMTCSGADVRGSIAVYPEQVLPPELRARAGSG
jgi:hypothetical protein